MLQITITRRHLFIFAIVIAAALVLWPSISDASHTFDDVDDDNVFHADIDWLAANGVTRGCNPSDGNTKFCPNNYVTRGQLSAFMRRLAENQVVDAGTIQGLTPDDLAGVEGPPGPQGDPGVPGPQGPAGMDGATHAPDAISWPYLVGTPSDTVVVEPAQRVTLVEETFDTQPGPLLCQATMSVEVNHVYGEDSYIVLYLNDGSGGNVSINVDPETPTGRYRYPASLLDTQSDPATCHIEAATASTNGGNITIIGLRMIAMNAPEYLNTVP